MIVRTSFHRHLSVRVSNIYSYSLSPANVWFSFYFHHNDLKIQLSLKTFFVDILNSGLYYLDNFFLLLICFTNFHIFFLLAICFGLYWYSTCKHFTISNTSNLQCVLLSPVFVCEYILSFHIRSGFLILALILVLFSIISFLVLTVGYFARPLVHLN